MDQLLNRLLSLPRAQKKLIFLSADTVLVIASLYIAAALRYGTADPTLALASSWLLLPAMVVLGPIVICGLGLPRIKLHAIENDAILRIAMASGLLSLSAMAVCFLLGLPGPRSVPLIFAMVYFMSAVGLRIVALRLFRLLAERDGLRQPLIIYGAGATGIQLACALRQSAETVPVLFVDDNANLHGVMVAGLRVRPATDLARLAQRYRVQRVLLAIPSLSQQRRQQLVAELSGLQVEVQSLPSFTDLLEGRGLEDSLKTVSPDALLGREAVDLNTPEVEAAYWGKVVMVTGAGGSIGSELCRQLVACRPARIVLFERSEFALYTIEQEFSGPEFARGPVIVACLGSVTNADRVRQVVRDEGVEIILHAAAYKHVPMVEKNEVEGAANNVIGTQVVADVARAEKLERFILVSTDKAVRPTNIMGATKRIAERLVQEQQTRSEWTRFAMVRFGNVLGSSGSVLPLFQRQIENGGPVTVTHEEVTRFFMTVSEAARLVLLAGAYAEGGDVFVLDMGQPQKIMDLARRMIHLSGRTIRDPFSGHGDIAIKVTGLRPGEKLYEELLVDDSLTGTPHPKILRASEPPLSRLEIASLLRDIQQAVAQCDAAQLRKIIETRVDGYHLPQEVHSISA